jgi:UDP-N-acetylmuramate--L-alanine ligase/UDP-N-acetylenolpyruvoylglucosamine reductase
MHNPQSSTPAPTAHDLLVRGGGHVHMAGICGVGMAGVAVLLQRRGFTVSGCDLMINKLAGWLRERQVTVTEGHAPSHLTNDVAWVVRSAAVPESSDEIAAARTKGLPVLRRGELLPALLEGTTSVAVAGTHGKTTTSSFIAQTLAAAGLDPSFCIGGEVAPLGGVAHTGQGETLVVEADESDGTLALYHPEVAVITNIEFDHMEHFANIEAFEACFQTFIRNTRRRVIYCADDPRTARLCATRISGGRSSRDTDIGYGLTPAAFLRAEIVKELASGTECLLFRGTERLGTFSVPAPGRHNVLNALACIATCLELGLTFDRIQDALARVSLPRRRFDRLLSRDDAIVISDYAHHPSEITALIRAAEHLHRPRLLGVFQPHRYTRTLALGPDFPASFRGLADLVLTPVYAASETPLPGGTVWDLYAHCRRDPRLTVSVATSLRQAWDYHRQQLRMGDVFLVIGAGDVERVALWARDELLNTRVDELPSLVGEIIRNADLEATVVRGRERLGPRTTLAVGGTADVWMEIGNMRDLTKVVAWTQARTIPFHVLGGGSNVLVSDLGVRGVVARLTGPEFLTLQLDQKVITTGASVTIARLLAWAEEHALTGLEFLESIPGTVGGAARGNAGAWGQAIADRVVWVRGLNPEGHEVTLPRTELDYDYRRCPALRGLAITHVGLGVQTGDAQQIRQTRADFASRRAWMKGLHSAGSVFRNPPGDYAGRLIEQAGLKGFTVGGATICERHANVIITGRDAKASDVLAVLETARAAVQRQSNIRLETEIDVWS